MYNVLYNILPKYNYVNCIGLLMLKHKTWIGLNWLNIQICFESFWKCNQETHNYTQLAIAGTVRYPTAAFCLHLIVFSIQPIIIVIIVVCNAFYSKQRPKWHQDCVSETALVNEETWQRKRKATGSTEGSNGLMSSFLLGKTQTITSFQGEPLVLYIMHPRIRCIHCSECKCTIHVKLTEPWQRQLNGILNPAWLGHYIPKLRLMPVQ